MTERSTVEERFLFARTTHHRKKSGETEKEQREKAEKQEKKEPEKVETEKAETEKAEKEETETREIETEEIEETPNARKGGRKENVSLLRVPKSSLATCRSPSLGKL